MGKKSRKKRREFWKIVVLILLIWFARRHWDAGEDPETALMGMDYLQGEWHAHGEEYDDVFLRIDADSICVIEGDATICDEEYSMNERTKLITSAYRQDFGMFALFEYRDGEDGINGRPVLVGSVLQQDGSEEEVLFSK